MQLKVEATDKWQQVIESVDKDYIPITCVKKVLFKFDNGKRQTLNLYRLRKQGLDYEALELVINKKIGDLGNSQFNIEFVIDVEAVAEHVQPLTDKILAKL